MKYTEIDKTLVELCDMATAFYSKANPKIGEIIEALDNVRDAMPEDDWNAAKDSVDAYADGMNLVMSGLYDYVHRKVAKVDSEE